MAEYRIFTALSIKLINIFAAKDMKQKYMSSHGLRRCKCEGKGCPGCFKIGYLLPFDDLNLIADGQSIPCRFCSNNGTNFIGDIYPEEDVVRKYPELLDRSTEDIEKIKSDSFYRILCPRCKGQRMLTLDFLTVREKRSLENILKKRKNQLIDNAVLVK